MISDQTFLMFKIQEKYDETRKFTDRRPVVKGFLIKTHFNKQIKKIRGHKTSKIDG